MGRKKELGLEYFPFDVDTFSDIKIRKLIKYQGGKAVVVYTLLLCFIYKNGYYLRWDKELPFIISESTGFEEAYIQEVIKACILLGLFSKDLFDTEGVITSRGIQIRFQEITNLRRRSAGIVDFNLITSEEKPISSEEMLISSEDIPISSEEMGITSEVMTIKGKESKVNTKKEDKKKTAATAVRFRPPSLEEVSSYIQEKEYSVDAQSFVAFYDSKNWYVGKNKMKNWHAAILTWERRNKNYHGTNQNCSRNGTATDSRKEESARRLTEAAELVEKLNRERISSLNDK